MAVLTMNQETLHTIDNYLSGTATEAEKAKVEALLEECVVKPGLTAGLGDIELQDIRLKMWKEVEKSISGIEQQNLNHSAFHSVLPK